METDKIALLRVKVVKAAQEIYSKRLVENGEGNVSVRVNKNEILVTPSQANYLELTPDKIVHMDLEGNVLGSNAIPSTEVKMHLGIYKDRKKAGAVIHNHSTYATILSVLRKSIPLLMEQQVIFLGGEIRCSEITTAHTEEMGGSAIDALHKNNAAILANHGAVVCGKSLEHAVRFAVILEKLAEVYWGALQIDTPYTVPPENLPEHEKLFERAFACYPKRFKK